MNAQLWEKISSFNFDQPFAEYGFSTRLADEQQWTKQFTQDAILEYKKFMYLAATSSEMVSPSLIVDAVWHQHLIFSQSYNDFCKITGGTIQHIQSTHTQSEFQKFSAAKERTTRVYQEEFGTQPSDIWEAASMFDSLKFTKTRMTWKTFTLVGFISMLLLGLPLYDFLRPVYIRINNPYFLLGLFLTAATAIIFLKLYNRIKFKQIIEAVPIDSFLFRLHPDELIYLKTGDTENLVHNVVSDLVKRKAIVTLPINCIAANPDAVAHNKQEHQILDSLQQSGSMKYETLVSRQKDKPVFRNVKIHALTASFSPIVRAMEQPTTSGGHDHSSSSSDSSCGSSGGGSSYGGCGGGGGD